MLPPIRITLEAHGAEQVKQAVAEITAEMRTAAQEARAHADALKADADAAKKRFQEAARAARDASEDQKDSSRKVANGLKDEAEAARDAAKAADENAKALEKINANAVKETTSALKEQVRAAEQARAANEDNARALNASSQRLQQIGMQTPGGGVMSIRANGGVGGMRDDFRQVSNSIRNAGDNPGDPALYEAAADSAQRLQYQLSGVRNAGIGMGVVGVMALRSADGLAKVSLEAQNARANLNNLLTTQQRGGDIGKIDSVVADISVRAHLKDPDELRRGVTQLVSDEVKTTDIAAITEAVVRNAQTLQKKGQDVNIEEISKSFSLAYAKGDLVRLQRQNIPFTQMEIDAVKAAYAINQATGQMALMKAIAAVTARDANKLGDSLSETQKKANDAARGLHDFEVNAGAGAAYVQTGIQGIGASILSVANKAPALEGVAGGLYYLGGAALAVGGPIIALVAQTFQAVNGFRAFRLAAIAKAEADTIASAAAAKAAEAEAVKTGVTVTSTGATVTDTAATEALAVAEGEAAAGAGTEAVAVTGAAGATGLAAIAAGFAGTAFGAMALGIWAAVAPLLVFVAIALAAAAAMKGLDYWLHHDEDEKLQKNIEAGNATNQKRLDNANAERKKRGQKEITAEQWQAMESDDPNATTPESKPSWNSGGEGSGAPAPGTDGAAPSMDELKKMMEDAKSGASTPAPSGTAPTVPALPVAATTGTATSSEAASSALPASDAAARVTQLQSETNPHGDDIRALQREKSALKGKSNAAKRDGLQKQIEALQDASRSWHASHTAELRAAHAEKSAADKAARLAASEEKKHEREEAKEARIDSHANLAVEKARIANAREDELDALGEELDKAKEDGNKARIRALTLQIEQVKARQRYDEHMVAAAIETDAYKRKADQEVAQIDLEHDMKKAARVADRTALSAGGGKDEHDAALRAMLSMSGGSRMPNFAALNPSLRRGNSDVARQDAGPISATATTSVTQSLGGARQLNITIPPVDLGYGGIADLGVGG